MNNNERKKEYGRKDDAGDEGREAERGELDRRADRRGAGVVDGLPPLAQALLIVQGADILTGMLCAVTGKSRKTESGKVSSGALLMGVMKKGLEWLVVGVCVSVGNGLGVTSVCGAADDLHDRHGAGEFD